MKTGKPSKLDVAVEEIYAVTGQYSKPKEGWPEQRVKDYIRETLAAFKSDTAGKIETECPDCSAQLKCYIDKDGELILKFLKHAS